jgi:ubiquinone biosynthesis monooxygenase Coq7
MRIDEMEHGQAAISAGGAVLPESIQALMRAMSKVMTTAAYKI